MSIRSMDAKIINPNKRNSLKRQINETELSMICLSIKNSITELLTDPIFREIIILKKDKKNLKNVLIESISQVIKE